MLTLRAGASQYGALAINIAQGRNMVLLRGEVGWTAGKALHSLKKVSSCFVAEEVEWLQGVPGAYLLDGHGG